MAKGSKSISAGIGIHSSCRSSTNSIQHGVLAIPSDGSTNLDEFISFELDGVKVQATIETQENAWSWFSVSVPPGSYNLTLTGATFTAEDGWSGEFSAWLITLDSLPEIKVKFQPATDFIEQPPMPPSPWPFGTFRRASSLGSVTIE